MRKFLLSILTFVPFVLPIYILCVCIWGELMPQFLKPNLNYRIGTYGHMYSRVQDVKNYQDVDILFLGTSLAYRGFDTRMYEKYGLRVFNFGSGSQTPVQTKVLLNRYLHHLNPELIIFQVSPMMFVSDGIEASVDLIANDRNDWETIKMLSVLRHIKSINTAIYGFYRDLTKRNHGFREPLVKGKDTYIAGGFVERANELNNPKALPAQEFIFNRKSLKAFGQILDECRAKKIDLMLVQAPITRALRNSFTRLEYFDHKMKEYGDYYNFNKILHLNDTLHFYDYQHLNQDGVRLFNEALIKILTDKKNLSQAAQTDCIIKK